MGKNAFFRLWVYEKHRFIPMGISHQSCGLPSGKLSHNYGKSPFSMGTSTISMAIFNSKLLVYWRVARSIDLSHMIWQPGCGHGSSWIMEFKPSRSAVEPRHRSLLQCGVPIGVISWSINPTIETNITINPRKNLVINQLNKSNITLFYCQKFVACLNMLKLEDGLHFPAIGIHKSLDFFYISNLDYLLQYMH